MNSQLFLPDALPRDDSQSKSLVDGITWHYELIAMAQNVMNLQNQKNLKELSFAVFLSVATNVLTIRAENFCKGFHISKAGYDASSLGITFQIQHFTNSCVRKIHFQ